MSNSANTFTSMQPMIKEVYSDGKKKKQKPREFKKIKDWLRNKKES